MDANMTGLARVKAQSAGEILQHFELSDEAEPHAALDAPPQAVIEKLIASENYHDAVTMLAHALPKREAVWWACLAAKRSTETSAGPAVAAVAAAEQWVRDPSEPNRLAAQLLGERARHKTAASWAATAASWCTGNMAEGDAVVPPPDYLYAHAVAASVTMAAVALGPDTMADSYQLFMRQGYNLAGGGSGQVE